MNKIFCDYCLKELNPKAVLNPKRLEFGRLTFQFPLGTSHRTLGGENHIDAESVEKLRKESKWQESDKLRKKIKELGYQIEDTKEGPKIKKL